MATVPTGLMKLLTRPTYVEFNLNRTPAKTTSMSGHFKTKDNTGTPYYTFNFATHNGFKYSTETGLRPFIEDLYARTGTENEELIALFDDDTSTYDLTTYNGTLTETQQNGLKVVSAVTGGSNIVVNTATVTGTVIPGLLFKKGDFIQPRGPAEGYRYPYQVTADVTYAASSNLTVQVNRPIIAQTGITFGAGSGPYYSGGLNAGKNVRFNTKVTKLPTYSIVPHDRVQFNGNFEMVEVIL